MMEQAIGPQSVQLEYIHEPFHYVLRPGQSIVLVASRK